MSLITRLRELIAALDRRRPQPDRPAERQIAADSAKLRQQAVTRISELEGQKEQSRVNELLPVGPAEPHDSPLVTRK